MKNGFLSEKHFIDTFKKPAQKTADRRVGAAFKKVPPKKKKVEVVEISSSENDDMVVD